MRMIAGDNDNDSNVSYVLTQTYIALYSSHFVLIKSVKENLHVHRMTEEYLLNANTYRSRL